MDKNASSSPRVTMFYDGACPLCRREVAHYKRVDDAMRIHWVDISRQPEILPRYGLDYPSALARLHVLDEDGRMHSGVQAFITVWSALPYYRWLAKSVRFMRIAPLLEWMYVRFARWRLARQNSVACTTATCEQNKPIEKGPP